MTSTAAAHARVRRVQLALEQRCGLGQGLLGDLTDRRGEDGSVFERGGQVEQLCLALAVVPTGPERQGCEAIGRRVGTVGDDRGQ